MHALLAQVHALLPGLHTLPAWTPWALLLAAGLFGVLCWMLLADLAAHLVAGVSELTPAGRAERLQRHEALMAQAEAILQRIKSKAADDA